MKHYKVQKNGGNNLKLSLKIKVYPYCISFNELGYSLIPKKSEWVLKWNNSLLDYFEDDMIDETFTRRKYFKMMKEYYALFERMQK